MNHYFSNKWLSPWGAPLERETRGNCLHCFPLNLALILPRPSGVAKLSAAQKATIKVPLFPSLKFAYNNLKWKRIVFVFSKDIISSVKVRNYLGHKNQTLTNRNRSRFSFSIRDLAFSACPPPFSSFALPEANSLSKFFYVSNHIHQMNMTCEFFQVFFW